LPPVPAAPSAAPGKAPAAATAPSPDILAASRQAMMDVRSDCSRDSGRCPRSARAGKAG
jgi:hypothetical protein